MWAKDITEEIFKFLNVFDLASASTVCKSWYDAAEKIWMFLFMKDFPDEVNVS